MLAGKKRANWILFQRRITSSIRCPCLAPAVKTKLASIRKVILPSQHSSPQACANHSDKGDEVTKISSDITVAIRPSKGIRTEENVPHRILGGSSQLTLPRTLGRNEDRNDCPYANGRTGTVTPLIFDPA